MIVNANPSLRRAAPDVGRIEALLSSEDTVHPTDDLDSLERAAASVAASRPTVVAIWGGDGTLTATLSALHRAFGDRPLPTLCVLPAGTMNTVSGCLGNKRRPQSVLTRLADQVRAGEPLPTVRRWPIRVDGHLGFLFGVGLIPNLLSVYDQGDRGGGARAFEVFAQAARGLVRPGHDRFFRGFEARVTADGRTWVEGRFTNISGGSICCLPFGLRPYHRATERPGAFQVVAHDLDARGALKEMVRIRAGTGMRDVQQDVFEAIEVHTAQPEALNLDGDNLPPRTRFELRGGPPVDLVTV